MPRHIRPVVEVGVAVREGQLDNERHPRPAEVGRAGVVGLDPTEAGIAGEGVDPQVGNGGQAALSACRNRMPLVQS